MEKGDLVNWDTARFELFNVKEVEQPLESICLPLRPGHVLMPEKRNLTHHRQLCRKLKGIVSAVADQKTQDQFNKIVLDHSACVETSGKRSYVREVFGMTSSSDVYFIQLWMVDIGLVGGTN